MITVVTFLWQRSGDEQRYSAHHVNTLHRAIRRYLSLPHRFVCATVDPGGLDPSIVHVPMTQEFVDGTAARYPKISLFRRDAAAIFGGERLLYSDLDVTPVADLDPLVERSEDFVIWRDPLSGRDGHAHSHRYNSSVILMNAGCRPQVYETFNAGTVHEQIRTAGLVGSDQAWIGLTLGPDEAVWTQRDGVLGFKHDLGKTPNGSWAREWPEHARLIISHGRPKPWELETDHPLRLAYERHHEKVAA